VYKDRAKHLVCDGVDLRYSHDIDDLSPEQFEISEVMPLAQIVDSCRGGNGAVDGGRVR
jgi:hypothetical protein